MMMASDPAADSELEVDVVIVGAGLSGIRAAVELHKAGQTIAILDRNNHVGGQCHSPCRSRITTIGDTHTEMLSLAKDFKLDLTNQQHSSEGLGLQQRYDWMEGGSRVVETVPALENVVWPHDGFQLTPSREPFSLIGYSAIQQFYSRISKLSETWHGPDALRPDAISFLELVKKGSVLSKLCEQEAHFLTNFLLGVHPDRVSALYVLDHIASGGGLGNLYFHPDCPGGGAQHFRIPQGSQAFVNGLLDLLPEACIHLSTVVNKITQGNPDHASHPCRIDISPSSGTGTNVKTFHAKKVLITTPPVIYSPLHSRDPSFIDFHPPLPSQKLASVNRHSQYHTHFIAVTFYFTKPWWREAGLSGAMDCRVTREFDKGVISWVRDTSTHEDADAAKEKAKEQEDEKEKEKDAVKETRWSLTCFSAAEKGQEVWDWMCDTFLSGEENNDFSEVTEFGPEDLAEMPVWRHLKRVFGEGRMDSLQEMPTSTLSRLSVRRSSLGTSGLEWEEEQVQQEEEEQEQEQEKGKTKGNVNDKEEASTIPLPISFSIRTWSGMGIPPPRALPKDKQEVRELLRTWKYEGPGKGDPVMRETFGHVHFAGTEIAEEWRGFMEGAARSGLRGAKEIIEALKKGEASEEKDGNAEETKAKL